MWASWPGIPGSPLSIDNSWPFSRVHDDRSSVLNLLWNLRFSNDDEPFEDDGTSISRFYHILSGWSWCLHSMMERIFKPLLSCTIFRAQGERRRAGNQRVWCCGAWRDWGDSQGCFPGQAARFWHGDTQDGDTLVELVEVSTNTHAYFMISWCSWVELIGGDDVVHSNIRKDRKAMLAVLN